MAGGDSINVGDGNNTVEGGYGNDTITAGSGNDQLSSGADNLTGQSELSGIEPENLLKLCKKVLSRSRRHSRPNRD